jgi:hypothetical protein
MTCLLAGASNLFAEEPPELLWTSFYGETAVAVAHDDGLLLYHANRLKKIVDDGEFGTEVWAFQMSPVSGIAVHEDGTFYVYQGARIVKFSADLEFLLTWGWGVLDGSPELQVCSSEDHAYSDCRAAGLSGSGEGQLSSQGQLAVAENGDVWTLERANYRLQRFSSNGAYIQTVGSQGTAEGEFSYSYGVTVAATGEVLVADHSNHRIQVFNADGTFSHMWGRGVATGADQLEICTESCLPGSAAGAWEGSVSSPNGVATDINGSVYVASGQGYVSKYRLDGSFLSVWQTNKHLYDAAVNSHGDIYVVWFSPLAGGGLIKYGYPYLDCVGYEFPLDSGPVTVRGKSRVLPLTAELFDNDGFEITGLDLISPPVIQVWFKAGVDVDPIDVTDDVLTTGMATEGNEFIYLDSGVDAGKWHFALKTTNYSASGTYTLTMDSADPDEYLFYRPCEAAFIRE